MPSCMALAHYGLTISSCLAPRSAQYATKAIDSVAGQTSHISLSSLSDKRSETGGLHSTLKPAIGARVMLTAVSDGLVNGARGEVVHVVTNNNSEVTSVLVKFDNSRLVLNQFKPAHIVLDFHVLCL